MTGEEVAAIGNVFNAISEAMENMADADKATEEFRNAVNGALENGRRLLEAYGKPPGTA